MNDDELNNLFAGVEQSQPTESAKQRALQASMAEFRRVDRTQAANASAPEQSAQTEDVKRKSGFFQGILKWLRPTVESTTEARSQTMNTTAQPHYRFSFANHKWQLAGVSTVSVMFLAVMLANTQYSRMESEPAWIPPAEHETDELTKRVAPSVKDFEMSDGIERLADLTSEYDQADGGRFLLEELSSDGGLYDLVERPASEPQVEALMKSESRLGFVPQRQLLQEIAPSPQYRDEGRDRFAQFEQQSIKSVATDPISTFSIDVDTASYSFVRRELNQGVLPHTDAVRIEEMVNYFDYDYPLPALAEEPFSTSVNVVDSPWRAGNKLVHIGIKGFDMADVEQPDSNLVFLLDVSGSMQNYDKLPLVKQSMELLLSQLKPTDTVSMVVYAGASGVVLEPTQVSEKAKILAALQQLTAGGSTAGGEGLKRAYQLAEANYREDAVNRVILATDGDFNVGISNQAELQGFIERKRDEGIYLSVLGFGQGNLNDSLMQALAQNGNGVAAYIDTLSEAQKVLVDEATSTLFPIAKDVKIQVEFNPATVSEYRLIGYETRVLRNEDFNNDKVDAGDIGAGHSVTAIYEITPVGSDSGLLPESRYGSESQTSVAGDADEYGFLKLRYKLPEEDVSKLISQPIRMTAPDAVVSVSVQRETAFATAVAGFAQLLKGGQYTGSWSYEDALNLAQANKGEDPYGYRTEFVQLIRKAMIASEL